MANEVAVSVDNLRRFRQKLLDEDIPANQIWRGDGKPPTGTDHIFAINYADGLVYYKNELGGWTVLSGGGGGSSNNAEFTVSNTSGWLSKTVAYGAECNIILTWSSIEDGISTGNGTLKIAVGGAVKSTSEISQGEKTIDVSKYLLTGSNEVEITISDIYGNFRTIKYSITTVSVSISSYFDATVAYTGDINFAYTPVGAVEKTIHFLVDGVEIGTQTVTASNREQPFTIPAQTHGSHTLEVYFTCVIDGQDVESNHLYYDLICYEDGNTTPIIACAFNIESVKQFATVSIPYIVYTPQLLTSDVTITDNFGYSKTLVGVDRTLQTLTYKADNIGTTNITIAVGEIEKPISFNVMENQIDVTAETSNLELYLTAKNRDNNEENPSDWSYGNIKADLQGFNFISDGWQRDENGDTVLRVSNNARVNIPFNIFETDFKNSGKTIEFEFATREVLNPNSTVISCWSGDRGLKITAQEALLKSEQNEVSRQYKEDERTRVTFVIQKAKENHLISLYINGVESKVVQYLTGDGADNFSQSSPVGISIGSNLCTTDIYCIRVYGNNLTRYQVLDNWIADTQNIEELITRADRNNIFDDYGNIDVNKIDGRNIPYFVIDAEKYSDLPDHKAEDGEPKIIVSGNFIDPLRPERSFTFYGAEIDVQGTSSQWYARKNYKIKFKKGFTIKGVAQNNYQLRDTSMPTNTFTFKTDFASSEGANNVELAMLYDEVNPERTPPQLVDKRVRQGIEGYPCLMFYYDGLNHHFIGKYNFNNDKGTPEVFGFDDNDESWEILLNNTAMAVWKDDNFSTDEWKKTFEARHPKDNTDITKLQEFASWLKSTDTTVVDTEEEKQARITKFRNEFGNYANVNAMLFNYVFTETFLMVDNRAKNAFPTMYDEDGKWIILPYDFDTAIGINNNGELKFGYWLEDIDTVNGNTVFNGQDSVLYVNMRLAFPDEIKLMYQTIRKNKAFSYEAIEERFANHQSVWGEAVFNEDSRFKYIEPLITEGKNDLPMLQGSKASQRKWWLYNRFRYLDSKYNTGDSASDTISFYAYVKEDLEITPYADIYAAAQFDSEYVAVRALRGNEDTPATYTIKNPTYNVKGEPAKDQVTAIFSASQLASVGDLSKFKIGRADFSKGTKLNSLKLGDGGDYDNPNLTNLTIGNLNLLTSLDVRNCSNLTQPVDVGGCKNIETVLCEGTKTTAVRVPNGGILKTLHLPETVTNLTIRNQPLLSEFTIENNNFSNIETLRLEGVDYCLFDFVEILNEIKPNSRVRLLGIEMNLSTAEEIFALYDKFDTFRGLDENGNTIPKEEGGAVLKGIIHCGTITGAELLQMQTRYPNITIDFEHIASNVYFYVEGKLVHTAIVLDGGDCYDPVAENIIDEPTKNPTDTTEFIFDGWDNDLKAVTADRTVNAKFKEEPRKYTIVFLNDNGAEISRTRVPYGTNPAEFTPNTPTKEGHEFIGWDKSVVAVVGDATYTAQYKPKIYTVTWVVGSVTKKTECAYGSTPTPPSGFEVGATVESYKISSWNISAITGDTTFTARVVVVRTGTITATASKHGAATSGIRFDTGGSYGVIDSSTYNVTKYVYLYGLNFEELRNKKNVKITGINTSFTYKNYSGTGNYLIFRYAYVKDFATSGTTTTSYTDLGDGEITLANKTSITSYTTTSHNSMPNTVNWINSNLEAFMNGYTTNSFGLRLAIQSICIQSYPTVTISYTYEEEV